MPHHAAGHTTGTMRYCTRVPRCACLRHARTHVPVVQPTWAHRTAPRTPGFGTPATPGHGTCTACVHGVRFCREVRVQFSTQRGGAVACSVSLCALRRKRMIKWRIHRDAACFLGINKVELWPHEVGGGLLETSASSVKAFVVWTVGTARTRHLPAASRLVSCRRCSD